MFEKSQLKGCNVLKDKKEEEKQIHVNVMDLVDWFLAIDACHA
jgi:hypothetical protein